MTSSLPAGTAATTNGSHLRVPFPAESSDQPIWYTLASIERALSMQQGTAISELFKNSLWAGAVCVEVLYKDDAACYQLLILNMDLVQLNFICAPAVMYMAGALLQIAKAYVSLYWLSWCCV